jgi:DNA-binding protein YbaB
MLNKFRELYDLKKKADVMKHQMEEIHLEFEDRGIKLKLRGDNHLEQVIIDGSEDTRVKDVINKALKEVQKKVAKKMQGELGELGIPGLK